jgi:predicted GIY-YIG superfamily endonuclease
MAKMSVKQSFIPNFYIHFFITMEEKISGVYMLYFEECDKIYIGVSTNIHNRFKQHLSILEKNKHYSKELNDDYFKYRKNLKLEILQVCKTKLFVRESRLTFILFKKGYKLYNYNKRNV